MPVPPDVWHKLESAWDRALAELVERIRQAEQQQEQQEREK